MQNSLRKAFVYRNVASIIAETELIKIPLHMLTANPVVYAVDSTFAIISPKGFNRIRICTTTNIDTMSVVNNMAFVSIPYYCCPLKLFIQNKLGLTLLTKYQPF